MDYDDTEQAGRDRQEEYGTPTLAQWARAQAVQAIYSGGNVPTDWENFADEVHRVARVILGV